MSGEREREVGRWWWERREGEGQGGRGRKETKRMSFWDSLDEHRPSRQGEGTNPERYREVRSWTGIHLVLLLVLAGRRTNERRKGREGKSQLSLRSSRDLKPSCSLVQLGSLSSNNEGEDVEVAGTSGISTHRPRRVDETDEEGSERAKLKLAGPLRPRASSFPSPLDHSFSAPPFSPTP